MIFGHFVGIGSNIGAKIHVSQAIRGLLAISQELTLSRVLETQPMGIASRSPFLNAVAYLRNGLSAGAAQACISTWLKGSLAGIGRIQSAGKRIEP